MKVTFGTSTIEMSRRKLFFKSCDKQRIDCVCVHLRNRKTDEYVGYFRHERFSKFYFILNFPSPGTFILQFTITIT